MQRSRRMQGLITERHFEVAERCFPGIHRFYLSLARKPRTFLELVWAYEGDVGRCHCDGVRIDLDGGPEGRQAAQSGR